MKYLSLVLLSSVLAFSGCNKPDDKHGSGSDSDSDSTEQVEPETHLAEPVYLPEVYYRDSGVKLIRVPHKLLILNKSRDSNLTKILKKLDDPKATALMGKETASYQSLDGITVELDKELSSKELNRLQTEIINTHYLVPAYIGEKNQGVEFEFYPLPHLLVVDSGFFLSKQPELKRAGLVSAPDSLQSIHGFRLMQVTEDNAFILRQKLINEWSGSIPKVTSLLRFINVPVMVAEESALMTPFNNCNPANWNLTSINCEINDQVNAKVAVMDYGFRNHTALNLATGYNLVDGSTRITSVVSNHGLRVTGVMGSKEIAVRGVAPGITIIPLALGTTPPTEAQLTKGINKAVELGARVLNMSLGEFAGPQVIGAPIDHTLVDPTIESAYARGLLMIAAAGNYANPTYGIKYPACHPLVMAIGAIDRQDARIANSCYKDTLYNNALSGISVVAPGDDIQALAVPNPECRTGGTSYATAQVSGLAAILFSRKPNLTNRQVRKIIENNTDILPSYPPTTTSGRSRSPQVGYGKINVGKALQALQP